MVVRHHVRDHSRSGYHVHDYERGHGKVTAFRGQYHGPLHGKLTYAERQKLSSKEFAIPSERKYPIDTANRARNALARVSRYGTPAEKHAVCHAVHEHYPAIHESHCGAHGPDPEVVANRRIDNYDAAEAEASRLRARGYKVRVVPVTPAEAGHFTLRKAFHLKVSRAT